MIAAALTGALPFPDIDPVLVAIGPLAIRWYSLAYIAGLILGWLHLRNLIRGPNPPFRAIDADDFIMWAMIAVIVGGLSVINTMVMTVSERVREIGIKKAVGAPTGAILREFVIEATLLGAIGGIVGLSAGALLVVVLNSQTAGSGTTVFLLTPMLLLRSFLFATVLGALAGIYPALRAARLDPVTALRST